jgi:hypothetical protein
MWVTLLLSVAHNIDARNIEKATRTRIRTAKAYSSVEDKKAKWPYKNVKDVTEKHLDEAPKEDTFKHLILAAPTVDITNLDTSRTKHKDNIEIFKQEVIISCQNMLTTAQNALIQHPQLKNVIVMEHPPRFDTADVDPSSLKPHLAKFANIVFRQMVSNSPMKHKIVLGQHTLDCDGKIRQARYTRTQDRKYDGVHMYGVSGRAAYSKSVAAIVSSVLRLHTASATVQTGSTHNTQGRGVQNSYDRNVFTIPVNNRFSGNF